MDHATAKKFSCLPAAPHSGYEVLYDMGLAHVAACSDGQGFCDDLRCTMLAQEHDLALGSDFTDLPRSFKMRWKLLGWKSRMEILCSVHGTFSGEGSSKASNSSVEKAAS